MKKILYGLKVAWAFYYFFLFALFFLLFYPLFYILLNNPKWHLAANNLRRFWAVIVFCLAGLPWSIKRRGKLKKGQSYVYCSNHFSYLDIPIAVLATSDNIRFMAKMELGNIPLFNIFFKTVDISVNRGNRADAYRAQTDAAESLSNGYSMFIFPEGTIGPNAPALLRFKNGAFRLAIEKQVPIVPITMINNWQHLHMEGGIYGKPGFIRAVMHEPVPTTGLTEADEDMLRDKVRAIIEQELLKHWPAVLVTAPVAN